MKNEEKHGGKESFDAQNEAEGQIVGLFGGFFSESGMVENRKNARRKLQRTLDKHSQNEDNYWGENAHVIIISRRGLIF